MSSAYNNTHPTTLASNGVTNNASRQLNENHGIAATGLNEPFGHATAPIGAHGTSAERRDNSDGLPIGTDRAGEHNPSPTNRHAGTTVPPVNTAEHARHTAAEEAIHDGPGHHHHHHHDTGVNGGHGITNTGGHHVTSTHEGATGRGASGTGPTGVTGAGPMGTTGTAPTGVTGAAPTAGGPVGAAGLTGSTGATTGHTGHHAHTGSTGATTGHTGHHAHTGATGAAGHTDHTGATGATGPTGTGAVGSSAIPSTATTGIAHDHTDTHHTKPTAELGDHGASHHNKANGGVPTTANHQDGQRHAGEPQVGPTLKQHPNDNHDLAGEHPTTADNAEHKPSAGEKIKGNLEKMAGKITGNEAKVVKGDDIAHGRT